MKKVIKEFLLRGMMFGGFGPVVLGIIYLILFYTIADFSINGVNVFLGIISTYMLAFIQAGATVFNQIESWSILKSLTIHLLTLYIVYLVCYLLNSWIPFDFIIVIIFTLVFIVAYFIIWFVIYLIVKKTSKKMNEHLSKIINS